MKFLKAEESRQWCNVQGLKVTSGGFLYFNAGDLYCLTLELEDKPSRIIALADYMVPTWKEIPFEGALLWIKERGIWGDFSESIGEMIIRQMRFAKGETEPLEKRPGHLFHSAELIEMHSYFVIPMLFGWDAFLIPEGKDYFIFISHDGVAAIVSRTRETYEMLYHRVLDWNPRENREWYLKGTGIPT